jgi:hypothetical protein
MDMTVRSQVMQTQATLKSVHSTLLSYSLQTQEAEARLAYRQASEAAEEIIQQLDALRDDRIQTIALHWTWELRDIVNGSGRLSELISEINDRAKPWTEVLECL